MSVVKIIPDPIVPLVTKPCPISPYTYNDLQDLNDSKKAYLSPLSVIGFIDLNAFFAQVEQIRLGLSFDDPVVCVQWQSLIAVSYAARKFGISRFDSMQSAKKKCPNLIVAHAAVYKKGESNWSYVHYLPQQSNHKVSLDSYRRESRKIIKLIQQNCDMVQKASVDECYLDFGRLVYHKLIELFPYLKNGINQDLLPKIPSMLPDSLQWKGEIIKSEEEMKTKETEGYNQHPEINDWGDICMLIGSNILFDIRSEVYKELGYTTSGGLARNKLVAKVAGGFIKPDNQTIVRNQSIFAFLNNFQLNDITGMGGKTGEIILQKFDVPPNVNSITYLRENYSLQDLQEKIKNDLSLPKKIYEIVRGNHKSELTYRVDVKSMMSAKNFTSNIDNLLDAYDWINVFAGDLYNRLIELDDENLNLSISQQTSNPIIKRPKTLSINISTSSYAKHSKRAPLPVTRSLDKLKESMVNTSFKLLKDLFDSSTNLNILNGGKMLKDLDESNLLKIKIIPLAYFSVTISNFVKASNSSLIDSYVGNNKSLAHHVSKKMFDSANKDELSISREDPLSLATDELKSGMARENNDYLKKLFKDFHSEQAGTECKDNENIDKLPIGSVCKAVSYNKTKANDECFKSLFLEFTNSKQSLNLDFAKTDCMSPNDTDGKVDSSTNRYNICSIHSSPDPDPKAREIQKEEKEYIKQLFENFRKEQSLSPLKSSTNSPQKPNIIQTLRNIPSSAIKNQLNLIDELIQNKYCSLCELPVEDVFEHNDYHVALELSSKINGHVDSPDSSTASRSKQTNKTTKKRKLDRGQSKLPF